MLAPVAALLQILLALVVCVAAICDIRQRRIPNLLVLPAAASAFLAQFFMAGLSGLRAASLGFGLGLLLYFPLWLLHARGAGDVKLLAAAGCCLGPGNTLILFILASIIGGVLALLLVLFKNRVYETAGNIVSILRDLLSFRRPGRNVSAPGALTLPHAPVIALASFSLLAMLHRAS